MKSNLLAVITFVVLAVVLQTAFSLPPDFFRHGRGRFSQQKRADPLNEIHMTVCSYCGYYKGSAVELACRQNVGDSRKLCTLAFQSELENIISEKGWH